MARGLEGWTGRHRAWFAAAAGCSPKGPCAVGKSFGLIALEKCWQLSVLIKQPSVADLRGLLLSSFGFDL